MVAIIERPTAIAGVSNAGEASLDLTLPYRVEVEIVGVCPLLFHRWQSEDVDAKGRGPKGSKVRKTDNLEAYVYRLPSGNLAIPGVYLLGSLTDPRNGAAKYRQDPRSPRKSALDLYKAAVLTLTDLADLGIRDWDYEDRRRATVQRNGITRVRPALAAGWAATFELSVTMPEYVPPADLYEALSLAGRAVGIADFRPTFGRFQVRRFEVLGN